MAELCKKIPFLAFACEGNCRKKPTNTLFLIGVFAGGPQIKGGGPQVKCGKAASARSGDPRKSEVEFQKSEVEF
jgi:hypothetical protein